MTESTEIDEGTTGFDRRSLIKKGLVVGGAAVALPIITTFDAPAFAQSSPPGTLVRAQFSILAQVAAVGGIVLGVLTAPEASSGGTPCGLTAWSSATDAPGGTVSGQGSLLSLDGGTVTYTSPTCVFVGAQRSAGGGCNAAVISNGGHTATFTFGTVEVNLFEHVYLLLQCP